MERLVKMRNSWPNMQANQLAVTSKYLNVVCKQYSNQTALKWMEHYLLEDVRYYLRNTNLTIKEVSNLLGFPNVSFFASYVKKHFGVSPVNVRKSEDKKIPLDIQ